MTTPVLAPDTVLPAGFIMRPACMDDLPAAFDLFNAHALAVDGYPEMALEDVQTEWNLESFNLERSTRVVISPDGQLVGYIEIWDTHDKPVTPWTWARVHPDFNGLGIATALRQWVETRACEVLDRCPPEARIALRAGCRTGHEAAEQLYGRLGMTLIRHFYKMQIDLTAEPAVDPLPEGIIIRTYQHDRDLPETVQAVNDSFRDHFGHVEPDPEQAIKRYQDWISNDTKFDATLWFLACDAETGAIAGVSLCGFRAGEAGEMGWVGTLGVRREYRRRGLGLLLLQHSFAEFWRRGYPQIGLGVDASNLTGALRLYERAGMRPVQQDSLYEKELRPGQDLTRVTLD